MQPEEFFSIFDSFLESFTQAKKDLENIKKKEEEETRKKREAEVCYDLYVHHWYGISEHL